MSHPAAWTCRSCRFVLGQVRDGVLRPVVAIESVDRQGVARVACPQCGRARVWLPAASRPAATVGLSTGLLDSGAAGRRTLG